LPSESVQFWTGATESEQLSCFQWNVLDPDCQQKAGLIFGTGLATYAQRGFGMRQTIAGSRPGQAGGIVAPWRNPIMRRTRFLLCIVAILVVSSPSIRGQETAQQQFREGYRQEQQGQFTAAIACIEAAVDADGLSHAEKGKAWILLGYAYKETGQYQKSQTAYERALSIFTGDSDHLGDYANTLNDFAGLYRSTGRAKEAEGLWTRALNVYRQLDDHRGMVQVYANLAGMALEQRHLRAAQDAIAKAIAETKSANRLSDDDLSLVSEVQGWILSTRGDNVSAIADYRQVVDLRRQGHGEYFPLTGWAYLILGRAYVANGQTEEALSNIRTGLDILDRTEGRQTPRYLAGEVIYSQALEQTGLHEEAARLKTSAQQSLRELYRSQCLGCTVSASSFR
jgi:tetratricopeptide (TPR) repeat protein